jgi:pimeloyl-ACP methyl ester carboxylesterase
MESVMSVTRVFVHGLDGSSHGTKGVFFRQRYPDMIIEDFHGPLEQRMDKLITLLSDKESLIIVGSSFGGLMAAIFACKHQRMVRKLILLAPALAFSEFGPYLEHRIETPVFIYHGQRDDVVPVGPVHEIAERVFENLAFKIVDDDHLLSNTFKLMDWDGLLMTEGSTCPEGFSRAQPKSE